MAETKDILLQRIRNGGTLSTGAQIRLCLMLSYPAILAQLSSVMMQYIDTSMVGHLGAAQGASIGLVSTCLWLWGGFCFAASTGFSVQVAHLIGANDFKGARAVLRQALTVAMSFSVALALIGASVSQVLPYWLGGGPDIVGDAGGDAAGLDVCRHAAGHRQYEGSQPPEHRNVRAGRDLQLPLYL